MLSLRSVALVLLLTLLACITTSSAAAQSIPNTCPVTKPEDQPFVPPSPYPAKAPAGAFWFGTDELWTMLPSGSWKGCRATPAIAFSEKLAFWRQGYDQTETQPLLTLTGRRLDAPSPPLIPKGASNGYRQDGKSFMVTGVNLPSVGCWELTAHYKEHDLTFVVWVSQ